MQSWEVYKAADKFPYQNQKFEGIHNYEQQRYIIVLTGKRNPDSKAWISFTIQLSVTICIN